MPKHHHTRGFSLVELLVVLGIVVVLIAMLLPALRRARDDALRVQCASHLRQIGMGLEMYEQAYKRLPGGDVVMFTLVFASPGGSESGGDALLRVQPGAADLRGALLGNKSCVAQTFLCPRQEFYGELAEASSYAMNHNYTSSKLSKGRADIILAYESAGLLAGPPGDDDSPAPGDDPAPAPPPEMPLEQDAAYRHHLRANWLFFDGHVDLLTGAEAAGPNDGGWGTASHSSSN